MRPRIISVGRLVEFKGFRDLIAACAELKKRGNEFECEIIGDGPLRAVLQNELPPLVLTASFSCRDAAARRVRDSAWPLDIFALAFRRQTKGASDIFPTVIIEAMAAARPVVSTRLAGVPESSRSRKRVTRRLRGYRGPCQSTRTLMQDRNCDSTWSAGRRESNNI